MRALSLLCLLLLSPSVASGIIRRHDVEDAQYVVPAESYPAVVDLFITQPGDCLATLTAPEWLLTAAHCAVDLLVGANIAVGANTYQVAAITTHPEWNDDTDDITLIRLDRPVPDVAPIPWYAGNEEVDKLVWFVGRGDTSTGDVGGGTPDGHTRAATNTVVEADPHWIKFVFNAPTDPEVTALEGISGDGDSGGPALYQGPSGPVIFGLSSFQENGSRPIGTYGVEEYYTRVSRYADWIECHVGVSTEPMDAGSPPEDAGSVPMTDAGAADAVTFDAGTGAADAQTKAPDAGFRKPCDVVDEGGTGCVCAGVASSVGSWPLLALLLMLVTRRSDVRFNRRRSFQSGRTARRR